MFDSGRNIDEASFGNGRLHPVYDKIDFRPQIGRVIHIAAYKANDLIVIMSVLGMRPWDGTYDPNGFNIKRSGDNSIVHVYDSFYGIFIRRLACGILAFEIMDPRRQFNISGKYHFGFSLWI